jgi:hypothetical protein
MKQIFRPVLVCFALIITGLPSVFSQQDLDESPSQQQAWEVWLSTDERRSDFWNADGWVIMELQKDEAALELIPCHPFYRSDFTPGQCALTPHKTLPTNYRLPDGGVLQLHSIARLEVLFSRYLINTSAK